MVLLFQSMVDSQLTVVSSMSEKLFQELSNYGIVPVIAINHVEDAIPLAKALIEGGLPVAEVTYRTDAAEESIRLMSQQFPEMLIAAGTVLTIEQVDSAVAAGATIIVSPGLNPKIVEYCQKINVPIIPGVATPSDIERALELNLNVVKFFPAEANGGISSIKALAAPYGNLRFMPTGGINEDNLNDYLSFNKILACGGTWMVKSDLIENKNFDKIRDLTKLAVSKMLDLQVAHIGVNHETPQEYEASTDVFSRLLMSAPRATSKSQFVDKIELMDKVYNGSHGHIGLSCNDVERAKFHLEKDGFEFDEQSALYKNGKLNFIYLKEEYAGFAIHLVRK